MHVIGVEHIFPAWFLPQEKRLRENMRRLLRLLSVVDLKGKTVAIEGRYTIEEYLKADAEVRHDKYYKRYGLRKYVEEDSSPWQSREYLRAAMDHFYATLIRYIQKCGGRVVMVDNPRLMKKRDREYHHEFSHPFPDEEIIKKSDRNTFGRTLTIVRKAKKQKAVILITGMKHAAEIKHVLGPSSRVTFSTNRDHYRFFLSDRLVSKEVQRLMERPAVAKKARYLMRSVGRRKVL